jgi:hypothetical protein
MGHVTSYLDLVNTALADISKHAHVLSIAIIEKVKICPLPHYF